MTFLPVITGQGPQLISYEWVPSLGITLNFWLDGLSLMFALLISGIGFFVIIYAGSYLAHKPDQRKLLMYLMAFMSAMLGVVLSSNLMAMFVFWELTSITSYMLIGYYHEKESSRKSALQGLFVTVGGGLALLAGIIMLGTIAGTYEVHEILAQGTDLQTHALFTVMMLAVLGGTFTKSAQFPFHFWLPNAMAAPTPVSSYLHSATMVKAGVYLMARLQLQWPAMRLGLCSLPELVQLPCFLVQRWQCRARILRKSWPTQLSWLWARSLCLLVLALKQH